MSIQDAIKSLSKKNETKEVLSCFSSLLDPQDMEVFILREKGCEVVFSNAKANEHARYDLDSGTGCRRSFAKTFPGICAYCPYGGKNGSADAVSFETDDTAGRTYSVNCESVKWIDGKDATAFFLRDITTEKEARDRLYALAYTDQLTGVPNRQRLKEDFGAMEERIINNEASGIIALFDLDHFKTVNDTYGHNTGDVVLRRLTEHLQGEKAFSGHLYRLGGDEFVFLYSGPSDRFTSEEEMKHYYNDLLSAALRSYTLPNITVVCTLSIGVSLFPKHGVNLSEVLRKADIALYKAKEGGRNRIVFFEDQYDAAQKFKDLYINIQPVLLGSGKTFGYELIERGANTEKDERVVSLDGFDRTIDALGFNDLENRFRYFISFSRQLLDPAVLRNLPKGKFIVQMAAPDKSSEHDLQNALSVYRELHMNGYKLALTGVSSDNPQSELLSLADYCKFCSSDYDTSAQKRIIASNPRVKFIAANVDSQEHFKAAKEAGFNLFQGFFFKQPVVGRRTKEINPLKLNYFRLLKLSSTEGFLNFREISSVISEDVALTYKLLNILNSAAVGLRNVSSIASAVAYIGEDSLKKWIAVLALRGVAEDKPLELIRMSLIRARFGELLAPHFNIKRDPQQVFMVGLLSLLHIALDKTKEELFEDIPVSVEIKESLLTRTGVYSDLLRFYENYEYANWETVSQFVEENLLDAAYVNDAYIESVKWYNDLAEA